MSNILIAKNLLLEGYTLALVSNNNTITSKLNGIKPLISLLNEGKDVSSYALADKIIGKAQAMLIVKAGIKEVYGSIMSKSGEEILKKHHITYAYDKLCDYIINREGTDMCPMEKTVLNIESISQAFIALNDKIKELNNKK